MSAQPASLDPTPRATAADCACPDFRLSRRRLLATTALAGGLAAGTTVFGDTFRQVAYGAAPGGNVLVVLSLRGGADGLSMVVPRGADHDTLTAARPGIVVPEASLIGGDARFGLHPAFAPLLPMWQAGTFGAVHAVGLPTPTRSHFQAMELIEDAAPGSAERSGWLNRVIGLSADTRPESGTQIGSTLLPTSLYGAAPSIAVTQPADLVVPDLGMGQPARRAALQSAWTSETSALGRGMVSALDTVGRLGAVASAKPATASYPAGSLQAVLANTATLIKADVGTRTVTIDYGNWDMHVGLGGTNPTAGWMNDQITHLAGSLKAFFADLGAAASRVTVVTLSEFGRRVAQNGSNGVDHGYGNAMLLLGAGVAGGQVRGVWPGLSRLTDGDVSLGQDYRSVLWEIIRSRFTDLSGQRTGVFPGLAPETVGSMAA